MRSEAEGTTPPEAFRVKLIYTAPMLRRVVRTFMLRRLLKSWLLVVAGALIVAGLLLWREGDSAFVLGVIVTSLCALVVYAVVVWRAHFRNTLGRFRAMDPHQAELIAHPETATFMSSLGSSTVPWRRFTEVWALPDCWMLFYARSGFLTLPTATLDAEMRAFLNARLPPLR